MVQQYMILKLFIFQNIGIEKKNYIYIYIYIYRYIYIDTHDVYRHL
jgi:hypothetical protein